jgi:hypothetical protein
MARTSADSSTDGWILLSVALALVTGCTGSVKEAKELLLHYLREGQIRWYFWRQRGMYPETETYEWHLQHNKIWNPDDPNISPELRWWGFWHDDFRTNRQVTIDWEGSSAICTAPGGIEYKLSVIRVWLADVTDALGLAGFPQADIADAMRRAGLPQQPVAPSEQQPEIKPEIDPFKTGGRPNAAHLVQAEACRRVKDKEVTVRRGALTAFAKVLETWWKEERKRYDPLGPPLTHGHIANVVRSMWNEALAKS